MKENYKEVLRRAEEISELVKRVFCYPELTYMAVPYSGDMLAEIEDTNEDFKSHLVRCLNSQKVKDVLTELDDRMKQYCFMSSEREEDEWCVDIHKIEKHFVELAIEEMKERLK